MKPLNPELESQIDALSTLCCDALRGGQVDIQTQAMPLLNALVIGGFQRLSKEHLQVRLESRVLELCQEPAIHRRAELSGITGPLQEAFEVLIDRQTTEPAAE